MLFTDIVFWIFLPVVFLLYWFPLRTFLKAQNMMLLLASYVFYCWWDWRFFGLIVLTSSTTFFSALLTERLPYRKTLTALNILFNVGILVAFKYFNFFAENAERLFDLFGLNLDWFTIDVLLPVGISFYTFQAIGYSVDVYKRKITPCRDIISFFTFVAYFPQLVAGPIERATHLLPQIMNLRQWDWQRSVSGMRMILFGLLKKLCVADMLALYVDRIFDRGFDSPLYVLAAGLGFTLQIYFDFSSYSEIARGVSRLLGIELVANFRFPYFSRNVIEFWQRWHISLMHWMRDYIYIPLGGNRKGTWRTMINIAIVFFISGLWHGAGWNFIFWGVYWGVCDIIGKTLLRQRRPSAPIGLADMPEIVLTMGVVSFGFYIFRCTSVEEVYIGLSNLWVYVLFFFATYLVSFAIRYAAVRKPLSVVLVSIVPVVAVAVMAVMPYPWYFWLKLWWIVPASMVLLVEWKGRNGDYPFESVPKNKVARYALYWLCLALIFLSEPTDMAFIYFQF